MVDALVVATERGQREHCSGIGGDALEDGRQSAGRLTQVERTAVFHSLDHDAKRRYEPVVDGAVARTLAVALFALLGVLVGK